MKTRLIFVLILVLLLLALAGGAVVARTASEIPAPSDHRVLDLGVQIVTRERSVSGSTWAPPVGIPYPEFGITETHNMYVGQMYDYGGTISPYKDAGNGPYTHYVDNDDTSCTDSSNPYGDASTPRCTFPADLPAGSVVEIHGGPYSFKNMMGEMILYAHGTADKPVFFRGVSSIDRPLFTRLLYVLGSYAIVENLEFYKANIWLRLLLPEDIHHIAIRNLEMYGDGAETGNSGAIILGRWGDNVEDYGVSHTVIYNNHIHDMGSMDPDIEADWLGVEINGYDVYHTWVVDNHIHHMGGDSVRTGNNPDWDPPYTSHHAYIGRNHFHHNGENAIDLKIMADVVYSQNIMHDFEPSVSSGGYAVTVHYDPPNNWVIFNTIYNASDGIAVHGVVDFYAIGNEIFDISGRGIVFWANGEVHIVGNTISNVGQGIYTWISSTEPHPVIDNIIYNINDPATGWHIRYSQSSLVNASDLHHNLVYQDNGPIRIDWAGTYNSIVDLQNSTGKCQGCVEAAPRFADALNNDYRLRAGSPAIDAGTGAIPYFQLYENRFGVDIRSDLAGIPRPQGSEWDIGAYEFVPELELYGAPGDEAIRLDWTVNVTLPLTTIWHIDYYTQTASVYTATEPLSVTRSTVLTEHVENYQWYTATLYAMLDDTSWLSDTVHVMPTNRFVYLPLVMREH